MKVESVMAFCSARVSRALELKLCPPEAGVTNRLVAAAIFLCCFGASLLEADIVHLKNGKQIECDSAWQEGKEIKYKIGKGIVGMPKSMVASIEKTAGVKKEEPEIPVSLQTQQMEGGSVSQGETADLEKKARTDPAAKKELSDSYTGKGLESVQKKDFSGALEYFKKAYKLSPNRKSALNLAEIYFVLQDDWNAEFYFNEVLKTKPDDTEALNYLGEIAWRKEDLSQAQEYWRKSYSIQPNPEIQTKLDRLKKESTASSEYENSSTRHFLIRYDGGAVDALLVNEISNFLEETYQQLGSRFEAYPSTPFIVVLYPRQQFFRVTDMPYWAGGVNDGKIKLPMKGIETITNELREVLIHELTHSFVRFKTSENCPAWLQEGLAQNSEGKTLGPDGMEALSQLIMRKQLPSVADLEGGFTGANSTMAAILYAQSLSFTEFLINHYLAYQLNELLENLGKGSDMNEAFQATYGESLPELEARWRKELVNVEE